MYIYLDSLEMFSFISDVNGDEKFNGEPKDFVIVRQ